MTKVLIVVRMLPIAGLVVLGLGCADSGSVPAGAFCASYARALCKAYAECCPEDFDDDLQVPLIGHDECESAIERVCERTHLRDYDRTEPDGRPETVLVFNEEAAASTVARVRRATESCALVELPERGSLYLPNDLGEPCRGNAECGAGLACTGVRRNVGECVAAPELGEECSGKCAEGLLCPSGTCIRNTGEGMLCESGGCGEGLYCDVGDTSTVIDGVSDGTCKRPFADGAACENSSQCSYDCRDGVCVPASADREDFWCYVGLGAIGDSP